MRLINSSYEIIEPKSYDLDNVFKHIELCGRVCYKSEDKITLDSATKFVDRMIKSGHTSVLEHGTIYLYREFDSSKLEEQDYHGWTQIYVDSPYSVISMMYRTDGIYQVFVTTNYRVIIENGLDDDLKYMVDQPMDGHERRYTVRFVCDRGVSHEFVRHRHFSFSQESTRYCNYSKDKFSNEITFIVPWWWNDGIEAKKKLYKDCWQLSEDTYKTLMVGKCAPQEARAVLPNALKTELIMTGFASDWDISLNSGTIVELIRMHKNQLNHYMKNLLTENIHINMETTNTNVKKFNEIVCKMADMYEKKNADYGDSFGQTCDEFGITAAIVRMIDKMNRIKQLSKNNALVTDESIKDTLLDLANYAVMTLVWANSKDPQIIDKYSQIQGEPEKQEISVQIAE